MKNILLLILISTSIFAIQSLQQKALSKGLQSIGMSISKEQLDAMETFFKSLDGEIVEYDELKDTK